MQKWEYLTVQVQKLNDVELSQHGAEGWELVGIFPNVSATGFTHSFTCVYKRPKATS